MFQDTIAVPLALLDCLSFKYTILYPSSDSSRFDPQLACYLRDSQESCCYIFVHTNMNRKTRTIFPKSAHKITICPWQLQQPSQTTTRKSKHQQTKHSFLSTKRTKKDNHEQPEPYLILGTINNGKLFDARRKKASLHRPAQERMPYQKLCNGT